MKFNIGWLCLFGVCTSIEAKSRNVAGSPVERVVTLLKDLKNKLDLDEKQEQQVYDKYACWCEKTANRKATDIENAQKQLRALGQTILTLKGKVATLTSEIEEQKAIIKAAEEAMDKATAIRQKENAAWAADVAETETAMVALQQAITLLIEATIAKPETSFLQARERAAAAIRTVIGDLPMKTEFKPEQYDELSSFLQASSGSKYMPQSLTVQGILTDMYSTFARDVQDRTTEEARANKFYEDFMNVKSAEKATAEARQKVLEELKAEAEAQLADTQQIYDDTFQQKAADVKFFDETKAACVSKHDDWTVRSELRDQEITGVQQAIDILSTDDARELFGSTIKAGKEVRADNSYDTGRDITAFLQLQSEGSEDAVSSRAYAALKSSAIKTHSLRLASLAVRVREAKVGHFEDVVKAIDVMIQTLKDEDVADIAKRDQCKDEYLKIESTVKNVTWLIKNNVVKIDKLEKLIELRTEQKDQTVSDIADVDAAMQALTAERTEENAAFLQSKADDQAAIDLLTQARTVLTAYYKKHNIELGPIQGSVKGLALNQRQPEFDISADQAPDAVFSGKGKRKSETKGIVQILTMIIEDVNDEIKNDMKAEEDSQLHYEELIRQATKLREELVAKKISLENAISKRNGELSEEELDKQANEADLQSEQDYKKRITDDCDFIIRTFEKRAAARTSEMQGLVGAKEYLAGFMKNQAGLMQTRRSPVFNDQALRSTRFLGLGR